MQEINATPQSSPHLKGDKGDIQEDVQICLSINKNQQICFHHPTRRSNLFYSIERPRRALVVFLRNARKITVGLPFIASLGFIHFSQKDEEAGRRSGPHENLSTRSTLNSVAAPLPLGHQLLSIHSVSVPVSLLNSCHDGHH